MKSFSSNGSKTDVDIVSNKLHKLIASSVLGLTDVTTRCGWFKLRERLFWAAMDVTQTLAQCVSYFIILDRPVNWTLLCVLSVNSNIVRYHYQERYLVTIFSSFYTVALVNEVGGGAFSTLDGRMVHSLSLMTRCTVNILTFMLEN